MSTELVVMGASWGGFEAVSRVLAGLPATFPVPILIAQHRGRSPDEAVLERSLGRRSSLPVFEVDDKDEVHPGHVYLAPADYHLLVEARGRVALSVDELVAYSRPSIDVLFDSAADTYGVGVAGVLLTGANEDGTEGLRAIRRRGGLTIVQDPTEAERSEMPASAVNEGLADQVLPLQRIPAALVEACS
jgi:two-component system, chemotaxis family, protein-glutamate methylesterase/glutaminase